MKEYHIIGPTVLILIWTLAVELHLVDPFFLPDPFSTIHELGKIFINGSVIADMLSTVERVFLAFFIAMVGGIPLGLVLGKSEKIYRSVEFVIDFFRSMPATALFPLFLLLFGVSDITKIAAAAFAALLIIIFNTAYGVLHTKKSRVLAAEIMGASKGKIFRSVLFWESLPQTCIGLRSAISLSLTIIIVTEMFIGTASGLGRKIIDAQITYEVTTMYAIILLTGIIGYGLNVIFLSVEKRVLHWSGK